jgi:hypothetical protein
MVLGALLGLWRLMMVRPSMVVFLSSFASPLARLQGQTMDMKLKLLFISFFFYACCSLSPVSWFPALCITLPATALLI